MEPRAEGRDHRHRGLRARGHSARGRDQEGPGRRRRRGAEGRRSDRDRHVDHAHLHRTVAAGHRPVRRGARRGPHPRRQVGGVRPDLRPDPGLRSARRRRAEPGRRGRGRRHRHGHGLHDHHAGRVLRPDGDRAVRVRVGARSTAPAARSAARTSSASRTTKCASGMRVEGGVEAEERAQRRGRVEPRLGRAVAVPSTRSNATGEARHAASRSTRSTCSDGCATTSPSSATRRRRRSRQTDQSEVQICSCRSSPTRSRRPGSTAREIGFTCAGSCDYLTGGPFAFVLEPRGRRRVAADLGVARRDGRRVGAVRGVGAAAARRHRHRARVRLGQVVAVEARRDLGRSNSTRTTSARSASTRRRSRRCRRARCSTRARRPSATSPRSSARSRRQREGQPERAGAGRRRRRRAAAGAVRRARRCAAHDLPPISDGAVAVVLARGDKARSAVRAAGVDPRPRPSHRGAPARHARPHVVAVDDAGGAQGRLRRRTASTSSSSSATFSPQELILRDALGLADGTNVNPSGGPLAANPVMATGLVRIVEVAQRDRRRHGATGARARDRRPGAAAQPRVRHGGGLAHGRALCGRRRRPDAPQEAPRRRLDARACARGRAARARGRRDARGPTSTRVVIGKAPDAFEGIVQPELFLADALGGGGQADAARAHRRQRRRLDVHRRRRTSSSRASTSVCSRVAWEKQSEGNAQWGLAGGRSGGIGAGGAFAPWIRAYIEPDRRARVHRLAGRGEGPSQRAEEPVRAPEDRRHHASRR